MFNTVQKFSLYHELRQAFGDRLTPKLQRKATLMALCHAVEDTVIESNLKPVIFTAFQDKRFYKYELARYGKLGEHARAVTLYGNGLSEGDMVLDQEWFVVINDTNFKALTACMELKPSHEPTSQLELNNGGLPVTQDKHRPFICIWSYDPEVVDFACRVLVERDQRSDYHLRNTVDAILHQPHQQEQQSAFVRQITGRILAELDATNYRVLDQLANNQQLLHTLQQQEENLTRVEQAKETVEGERSILRNELKHLYNDLTRSQQITTELLIEKAQQQQLRTNCEALIQQIQSEIDYLSESTLPHDLKRLKELVTLLQKALAALS